MITSDSKIESKINDVIGKNVDEDIIDLVEDESSKNIKMINLIIADKCKNENRKKQDFY